MKMCMNFDRHCRPHHFHPGMDHFRRHNHPYAGHNQWNYCRRGPLHHGGPPGFPHALPPFMFMGANCHHHPHPCQHDYCSFERNRPNCHHCCRNNDRPEPQPLSGRPLSCPPFGRPPFGNGPYDQSVRSREPFNHSFGLNCSHLTRRRDRRIHNFGHCGNSSAGR